MDAYNMYMSIIDIYVCRLHAHIYIYIYKHYILIYKTKFSLKSYWCYAL